MNQTHRQECLCHDEVSAEVMRLGSGRPEFSHR